MGDSFDSSGLNKSSEISRVKTSRKSSTKSLIASCPKPFSHLPLKRLVSLKNGELGRGTAVEAALFLLKIAALETVRRFSRARCPFVWSGLQFLQLLCYPPLKWIQRWNPFRAVAKGMQVLSRPLLVLSIANALFDESGGCDTTEDVTEDSRGHNDSGAFSESQSEFPSVQSTPNTRSCHEAPKNPTSPNWLLRLYSELDDQKISLPERINEDELRRFYAAANGDFSSLLTSVKKTIRWRETYRILSGQELNTWSPFVFWHGFDVMSRPCLVVRLGLACISLPFCERPRFAQAVVSQVEYGVLHLVGSNNPRVTVIVDCEGLSPLRLPMQVVRSCSALLQDHFPNRLGCLFVIRLPPVVRIVAQTFIQVLKPVTKQKLKVEGVMYRKVLSEYLQTLPSYLGGVCTCTRCSNLDLRNFEQPCINEDTNETETNADVVNDKDLPSLHQSGEIDMQMDNRNCDAALRSAMVGILIFLVLVALVAGVFDPESHLIFPP